MKIENYRKLILALPVKQQCFTTKRKTWAKAENSIKWLKNLNDRLFHNSESITLSRQDVFETEEIREKIIKAMYWGYPAGMRGNHFINLLKQIKSIEEVLQSLKNKSNPTAQDFNNLTLTFNNVSGLGISSYSKLLYFFEISLNGDPCLILDNRLINVFKSEKYINFQQLSRIRTYNAENYYIDYLQLTKQLATTLETQGENIELFLFTFGNNLKIRND